MTARIARQALVLGLGSGLALAATLPVSAQLQVRDGGVTLRDADVFVPTDGSINSSDGPTGRTDPRSVIYNSILDQDSLMIQTNQGPIPMNAIFRRSTLPTFTGDITNEDVSGSMNGTLSFRGFGRGGSPEFFNVPTTINFTIPQTAAIDTIQDFSEFRAEGFILQETGFVVDGPSFGVVQRRTPVSLVQYGETDDGATDQTVLGNDIPADAYTLSREGESLSFEQLDLSFDSGTIFSPPGIGLERGSARSQHPRRPGRTVSTTVATRSVNSVTVVGTTFNRRFGPPLRGRALGRGRSQGRGVSPRSVLVASYSYSNFRSGQWCESPVAGGFSYTMVSRRVPVGVASRVFPGLVGIRQAQDAKFKRVKFPKARGRRNVVYVVSVQNIVLGEFAPESELDFNDYASQLGELLEAGQGVQGFLVTVVDAATGEVISKDVPLQLEFNTEDASFEVEALDEDGEAVEVDEDDFDGDVDSDDDADDSDDDADDSDDDTDDSDDDADDSDDDADDSDDDADDSDDDADEDADDSDDADDDADDSDDDADDDADDSDEDSDDDADDSDDDDSGENPGGLLN